MSDLSDLPLFSGAHPVRFDGPEITEEDTPRLSSQLEAVRAVFSDGKWHQLTELAGAAKCSTQSASARLRDMRKSRFGGFTVERRRISGTAVFEYRIPLSTVEP
jgi:hypothetical protein